jgi:hypothetical protein
MPWIDDDMKAEVERRLRDAGLSVTINRIHVDLGPEATRENVTEQLVSSFIEAEQARQRGEPSQPPVTGRKPQHINDVLAELGIARD